MFKTLKNAWKIPELKNKLLFTLLIIILYRVGSAIPVPYFAYGEVLTDNSLFQNGILNFLSTLSGGALAQGTLLALGVSPYITASIVIQLLTVAIPALERLSKEGEEGRKKINFYTRIVTVILAIITAIGYTLFVINSKTTAGYSFYIDTGISKWFAGSVMVFCYCAGAMLVMWLAEKINDHGIGNGISIILFANIVTGFFGQGAALFNATYTAATGFNYVGLIISIVVVLFIIGLIMMIVWMSDAERRIPIQYAKRVVGRKMYGGQNTNLPIKVNMSGVMPIIFANSIVMVPVTLATFLSSLTGNAGKDYTKIAWPTTADNYGWEEFWKPGFEAIGDLFKYIAGDVSQFVVNVVTADNWENVVGTKSWSHGLGYLLDSLLSFDQNSIPYFLIFAIGLIFFAYFYVAISFNPVEVANNIKNNGGAIPGIRSGKPTVEFIKKVLNRVTLIGALLVAVIACVPMIAHLIIAPFAAAWPYAEGFRGAGALLNLAYGQIGTLALFGGSSLMIVVGVALETTRELEAQMSLRNYKGFLD